MGPVALSTGGTRKYKDLGVKVCAPEETSNGFRKQQLSKFYYSDSFLSPRQRV
jgi:hypothetical protein